MVLRTSQSELVIYMSLMLLLVFQYLSSDLINKALKSCSLWVRATNLRRYIRAQMHLNKHTNCFVHLERTAQRRLTLTPFEASKVTKQTLRTCRRCLRRKCGPNDVVEWPRADERHLRVALFPVRQSMRRFTSTIFPQRLTHFGMQHTKSIDELFCGEHRTVLEFSCFTCNGSVQGHSVSACLRKGKWQETRETGEGF